MSKNKEIKGLDCRLCGEKKSVFPGSVLGDSNDLSHYVVYCKACKHHGLPAISVEEAYHIFCWKADSIKLFEKNREEELAGVETYISEQREEQNEILKNKNAYLKNTIQNIKELLSTIED